MMLNRSGIQTLGGVALVAILAGCGASTATTTAAAPAAAVGPATPEMIAQGRTLFSGAGRCSVCHGQGGRGGSLGPNLQDDDWIWVDTSQPIRPQLAALIQNGIDDPRQYPAPMPAMGGGSLTAEQVAALAAYVESL